MINYRSIARQLTLFIRQQSTLTVEEMCPITLSVLCYRFVSYDIAQATGGKKDHWSDMMEYLGTEDIEPRYILQSKLTEAGGLFGDVEIYEIYSRIVSVISRLPKGGFCKDYVSLIDELTKDYCLPVRRVGLFNYIMQLHGGRYLELIPNGVGSLMGQILRRVLLMREKLQLYDPSCGVSSLAMEVLKRNSGKFDRIVLREVSTLQADMARLSLYVNSISQYDLKNEDFLRDDWVPNERYDAIVSMPAWGIRRRIDAVKQGRLLIKYPEFNEVPYDYACILRGLESLKEDGVMVMAMPMNVLTQRGIGETVRREIITRNDLRAVIGMPVNMLYSTSVAFVLLVFQHSNQRKDVLMVNAKELYEGHGRLNRMRMSDQQRIVQAFSRNRTIPGLSRCVSFDEIAYNNYSWLPSHYVSDPTAEEKNISEKIKEINELTAQMRAVTREHNEYLRQLGLPELEL